MNTDPRDYTPAQAADRMQISEKSVYALLNSGELRGYRVGRLWRIRPQDLESTRRPVVVPTSQTTSVRAAASRVSRNGPSSSLRGRLPGWNKFAPEAR